jgi:hypothetical protein
MTDEFVLNLVVKYTNFEPSLSGNCGGRLPRHTRIPGPIKQVYDLANHNLVISLAAPEPKVSTSSRVSRWQLPIPRDLWVQTWESATLISLRPYLPTPGP